jgi:hypothetical protein
VGIRDSFEDIGERYRPSKAQHRPDARSSETLIFDVFRNSSRIRISMPVLAVRIHEVDVLR